VDAFADFFHAPFTRLPKLVRLPVWSGWAAAQVIIAGHAFIQNVRRGHYELAVDVPGHERVAPAFTELARTI
jgi:hypothetical protein